MPWTSDDVEEHNKGLSAKKKRQWVAVANSSLKKCIDAGGTEATCAASAIRQANGVVASNESVVNNTTNGYIIRNETHQERPHIVVPVVMMREGVHAGSHGPLFHSVEELSKFIGAWNGIPVSIQHPEEDGTPVSANIPEIIDSQTVGRVYNAYMNGDKLCAEAWIDVEKIKQVSPETLALIQAQRPLDVSVGVFSEEEMIAGTWNGESYTGVARGHRPDHLALLPGGVGACSWEDGCGVRANECKTTEVDPNVVAKCVDEEEDDEEEKDDDKLEDNKQLSGKVSNNSKEGGEANLDPTIIETTTTPAPIGEVVVINKTLDEIAKGLIAQGFFVVQSDQSLIQTMDNIRQKLDRMDDDVKIHFLQDVYDNYFIYEVRGRMGAAYSGSGLYKRPYTVGSDGVIEFTGEPQSVRKEVSYVTNSNKEGSIAMPEDKKKCCPEKVNLLIQSEFVPYAETDREFLSDLEESQIDKLLDMEKVLATPKPEVTPAPVSNEQAIQVLKSQLSTPDQFLNVLDGETREMFANGLTLHRQQKAEMITTIKANSEFTDAELSTKSMPELAKLAKMARTRDYSGMNGGVPATNEADNKLLPPGVEEKGGN